MVNQIAVDKLSALIQINGDRIESYEKAVKKTDDGDLKEMFNNFIQISKTSIGELVSELNILGGEVTESTKDSAKSNISNATKDNDAIIEAGTAIEDHALKTYDKIMKDSEGLTSAQQSLIEAQYHKIKRCSEELK